jgi:gliding motility-associated-like protein
VRSTGGYYAPDTIAPFLNRSQKDCAVPADLTPPEVPQLTVTTDCETVELSWTFSNDSAYLDVYQYYIYYKSTVDEDFSILDSFYLPNDCYTTYCTYSLADLPYVIGCFAMAAIDTVGNLSQRSDSICFDIDDCFTYELPNIITPNGDGYNDILVPFPYKNVQGVDFYLYNRWGRLVYKTSDIDIHWDGTDMSSHQTSSDGTYYYVCQVHLHSLHGPMTKELHGTLTVIR